MLKTVGTAANIYPLVKILNWAMKCYTFLNLEVICYSLPSTNVKCTLHHSALDPTNATHSPQTSSALLHLSGDGTKNKAK